MNLRDEETQEDNVKLQAAIENVEEMLQANADNSHTFQGTIAGKWLRSLRLVLDAVKAQQRSSSATAQTVFCIVPKGTNELSFEGQSQIASVPVFETRRDAELEQQDFEDLMNDYEIKEARLSFWRYQ